jgi:hypothetical protein
MVWIRLRDPQQLPGVLAVDTRNKVNLNRERWYSDTQPPTLGAVRGKCFLVRAFSLPADVNPFGLDPGPTGLRQLRDAEAMNIRLRDTSLMLYEILALEAPAILPILGAVSVRTASNDSGRAEATRLGKELRGALRGIGRRCGGLWVFQDYVEREIVESIVRLNRE